MLSDTVYQKKITILSIRYPPEKGAAASRIAKMAIGLRIRNADVNVITALPNYPTGRIFPNYRRKLFHSEIIDHIPVKRYCHGLERLGVCPPDFIQPPAVAEKR